MNANIPFIEDRRPIIASNEFGKLSTERREAVLNRENIGR